MSLRTSLTARSCHPWTDLRQTSSCNPMPNPVVFSDQIKSQLGGIIDDGIIEPVTGLSEWCHAIVLVEKKGTAEMLLTVHLRKPNNQVYRLSHLPVHRMMP
eukprot:scpid96285/ scgid23579/ 